MAKKIISNYTPSSRPKRPGVHSKNASKGQNGYKQKYRGQGRWEKCTIDLKDFIQVLKQTNELVYVKIILTHVNAVMVAIKHKVLAKYNK
jgi:hypothetical protein